MADEENNTDQGSGKKKLPTKMLIIIGIVMLVEGAVFGAGFVLFSEKPPAVMAEGLQDEQFADGLEKVEVLLIGDKFQNTRQGAQAYLYDATIYIVVRRRDQEYVEQQIQANMARISEEVTEVFARAEPAQLNEPDRKTLKRQILEKCRKRFGPVPGGALPLPKTEEEQEKAEKDPQILRDEDYYVLDVVISNWKRFSADL